LLRAEQPHIVNTVRFADDIQRHDIPAPWTLRRQIAAP
jgi:hypothetical protein